MYVFHNGSVKVGKWKTIKKKINSAIIIIIIINVAIKKKNLQIN